MFAGIRDVIGKGPETETFGATAAAISDHRLGSTQFAAKAVVVKRAIDLVVER